MAVRYSTLAGSFGSILRAARRERVEIYNSSTIRQYYATWECFEGPWHAVGHDQPRFPLDMRSLEGKEAKPWDVY